MELGYVGKELPASKSKQPDKSKAGGWPVGCYQKLTLGGFWTWEQVRRRCSRRKTGLM